MAPVAGRIADRGWTKPATVAAMLLCAVGFALTLVVPLGTNWSLALLVVAAVAIDCGAQLSLILGYRVLFVLGAGQRSRLNGLFMTTFFVAGAAGSGIGAFAYAHGGWTLAAALGTALPLVALAYSFTEQS